MFCRIQPVHTSALGVANYLSDFTMAEIRVYRDHVTGYPVKKYYYGACAADGDQFLTGYCSSYRQCNYSMRSSCKYPVIYGNSGDISNTAPPEMVSQSATDTGSCSHMYGMSADFRSDRSKLVQGRTLSTSTHVEIYPWMKETRQNNKRRLPASLPG